MNKVKIHVLLVCFTLLILAGCAHTMIKSTDLYAEYFDDPIPAPASSIEYSVTDGIHTIRLSGEEYGMGYEYGKLAAELDIKSIYTEIFRNTASMLADDAPEKYSKLIEVSLVQQLLLDAWERMEPHVPRYTMRMLKGFSDGSGIPLEDVYAVHAIPDLTESSCSALWATGAATESGETLQIRVLDYIMGLGIQKYPVVVFYDFHQGHTVANVGWLGLLGVITGMNDGGLGVSEMGYGNPEGEHFHAMPMPFLLLDILRWCDNPSQADGIIRSAARTNSYVYIIGNSENQALAFVTNPYQVESIIPGETDALVPQLPDCLQAGHYEDRMTELVAEGHGSISLSWLRDDFIPRIAMDSNLQSVIYELDNLRFHVANADGMTGKACDQPYISFDFPGK